MKKKINITNGDETNDGTFAIDGKIYTFPFTSSCYRREKVYFRGDKSYRSKGIIELDLCFGEYKTKKALQKLGIKSTYQSRTSYEHYIQQHQRNISELVRGSITTFRDKLDLHCFAEVKRQIPNGLVDLINETDLEFVVEPRVSLGDETFNREYAIFSHNLVIRSKDLFDAEVRIE